MNKKLKAAQIRRRGETPLNLEEILFQMNELKLKMADLWDIKGETDPEILRVSIEIDELLNKYYRLTIPQPLSSKVV